MQPPWHGCIPEAGLPARNGERPRRYGHSGQPMHVRLRTSAGDPPEHALGSDDGEHRPREVSGDVQVGDRNLERVGALGRPVRVANDQPMLTLGLLGGRGKRLRTSLLLLGPGERPLAGVSVGVHVTSLFAS